MYKVCLEIQTDWTVGRRRRSRRVNIKAELASKQFVKQKATMKHKKKKLSGQFRKLVWFHKVPDRGEIRLASSKWWCCAAVAVAAAAFLIELPENVEARVQNGNVLSPQLLNNCGFFFSLLSVRNGIKSRSCSRCIDLYKVLIKCQAKWAKGNTRVAPKFDEGAANQRSELTKRWSNMKCNQKYSIIFFSCCSLTLANMLLTLSISVQQVGASQHLGTSIGSTFWLILFEQKVPVRLTFAVISINQAKMPYLSANGTGHLSDSDWLAEAEKLWLRPVRRWSWLTSCCSFLPLCLSDCLSLFAGFLELVSSLINLNALRETEQCTV